MIELYVLSDLVGRPDGVMFGFRSGRQAAAWSRTIAHWRNVRGLGKSMVVFRFFEKPRHSNERSTKFESLKQE